MVIESQLDQSEQLRLAIKRMIVPCVILTLVALSFFIYASKFFPDGIGAHEIQLFLKYFSIPFAILVAILAVQKGLRGTATSMKFNFYPEKMDIQFEGIKTPEANSFKYSEIKKIYVSKNMLTINPVYKALGEATIDFTNTQDLQKVAKAIEKHCPNLG